MDTSLARSIEIRSTNSSDNHIVGVNVINDNLNPVSEKVSTSRLGDLIIIDNNIRNSEQDHEYNNCNSADNSGASHMSAAIGSKKINVIRKKDIRCKICNGNHPKNRCTVNKKQRRDLLKKKAQVVGYPHLHEQCQQPKVSMDGTGEKSNKPVDPIPIVINFQGELDDPVGFSYVDENHTIGFVKKVSLWYNKKPNIQYDTLPVSIIKMCTKFLGFGRGNIHFNTYTSKVWQSKLYEQWAEYFIDNDDLDGLSDLKKSIIHYFFHDLKVMEYYYPLFKANEGFCASINTARPILDSKNTFTAIHSIFLSLREYMFIIRLILTLLICVEIFDSVTDLYKQYLLGSFTYSFRREAYWMIFLFFLLWMIKKLKNTVYDKKLLNNQYDTYVYTLCKTFPRLSVYIEEIIKEIKGGWWLIGVLERIKYGTWKQYEWHKRSMKWPFKQRVRLHLLLNERAVQSNKGAPGSYLSNINMTIEEIDVELLPFLEEYDTHEVIEIAPSRIIKIEEKQDEYYDEDLDKQIRVTHGGIMGYEGSQLDPNEYRGYFPLLYNVSTMKKPAPSFDNLLGAWHYRALDIPNSVCNVSKDVTDKILRRLPNYTATQNAETKYEWYASLKSIQKQRMIRVQSAIQLGDMDESIEVTVKSDELLSTREKMIPRLIYNVSGVWLDRLGETAKTLSNAFSEIWDSDHSFPINYKDKVYYVYFTCGASSASLSKFYQDSKNVQAYHLLVLGDDLLVWDGYHDMLIENDFSKYDRTQSYDLQDIFITWLECNGHYGEAIAIERMLRSPIKPRCRKVNPIKISGSSDMEMMFTGQPFTCLQNSLINVVTTIHVLDKVGQWNYDMQDAYTYAYESFGLKAKIKFPHENEATFLKGVFLDGIWVRLPSFLTKFGKIMTPPNEISVSASRIAQLLSAQWKGYGNLVNNWFYRAFGSIINGICAHNGLREIDSEIHTYVRTEMGPYSIRSETSWVCDETFNNFMLNRYGITEDMMDNFLDSYRKVRKLPAILHDPMILILESCDY